MSLKEIVSAVKMLESSWEKCSEVFEKTDDINRYIADLYPFEKSFDEYISQIHDWVKNIENQAKTQAQNEFRENALMENMAICQQKFTELMTAGKIDESNEVVADFFNLNVKMREYCRDFEKAYRANPAIENNYIETAGKYFENRLLSEVGVKKSDLKPTFAFTIDEAKQCNQEFEIDEFCPYCGREAHIKINPWYIDFKCTCNHCGKNINPCSLCNTNVFGCEQRDCRTIVCNSILLANKEE